MDKKRAEHTSPIRKGVAFWITIVCLVSSNIAHGQDLLVKFREGADKQRVHRSAGALDTRSLLTTMSRDHQRFGLDRIETVRLQNQTTAARALETYRSSADVDYVVPNHRYRLESSTEDSLEALQWNMELLEVRSAWESTRGESTVVVAIIDTGCDLDHPDLVSNIWKNRSEIPGNDIDDDENGYVDDWVGWDFVDAPGMPGTGDYLDRDNDPADEGPSSHGTHVAGIVAAKADNGIGVVGMAPGCKVMVLRAGFGPVGYLQEDDVSSAIVYAADNGANIINMSWGDNVVSPIIQDVLAYAEWQGCLLIASAGNSGSSSVHFPSGYQSTIAVGATTVGDELASFSNYGPTIDVVAPGKSIVSTFIDGYGTLSGTSMAAPHVAGLAALVFSLHPDLSAVEARQILAATALDLGNQGRDNRYGWGRIQPPAALLVPTIPAVELLSPTFDAGVTTTPVPVVGTAAGVGMLGWDVAFSSGEEPVVWDPLCTNVASQVYRDTLCYFDPSSFDEGPGWLRVRAWDREGAEMESRTRIFIDRTPPSAQTLQVLPMLEGQYRAQLLTIELNEPCRATMHVRDIGSADYNHVGFRYQWDVQRMLLSSEVVGGADIEYYLSFTDRAGLASQIGSSESPLSLLLDPLPIQGFNLEPVPLFDSVGHFLRTPIDLDKDGRYEIVLGELVPSGTGRVLGQLRLFELEGSDAVEVASPDIVAYPRGSGDTDGDGRIELLLTYGTDNWLYEADETGLLQQDPVWQGSGFWGGWLADLDGDGFDDLLAVESGVENALLVLRGGTDGIEAPLSLTNMTPEPNGMTPPTITVADIDRDGRPEAIVGDAGGDVFAAALTPAGLEEVWRLELPLENAFYLADGDFDADGYADLVVGTHSSDQFNSEHEYDARHWVCSFVRGREDGSGVETFDSETLFGVADLREVQNGVGVGDMDSEPGDEVAVVSYPELYIFAYDSARDSMKAVYHRDDASSNHALFVSSGTGGNPLLVIGTSDGTLGLRSRSYAEGPLPPAWVEATPLGTDRVALRWSDVPGADRYLIHRAAADAELALLADAEQTSWTDSTVEENTAYFYAIATVDSQMIPMIGDLSEPSTAVPNSPPRLERITRTTQYSIRLQFSEPIDGPFDPAQISLLPDPGFSSSLVDGEQGTMLLATWTTPLPESEATLHLEKILDRTGIPLASPTDTVLSLAWLEELYLSAARCQGDSAVALQFSAPLLDAEWSEDQVRFMPRLDVAPPVADPFDESIVLLMAREPLVARETSTIEIQVEGFIGKRGESLADNAGRRIMLVLPPGSLANVRIVPNPVIARGGSGFGFIGLPRETTVRIYNLLGRQVASLLADDSDGALTWAPGSDIAGGIYIYRAAYQGEATQGKLVFIP